MEKLDTQNLDPMELKKLILSLIDKKHTSKQIAEVIGTNLTWLNRFMKEHSIYHSYLPRYNYKTHRFEIADELSAYIAGLYWSDGHLAKDRLTITFWEKDEVLITEIINKYFFGDFLAYKYSKDSRFIALEIFNKQIRDDFLRLGLVNNDAGRTVPNVPIHLFRHFLRGMIDGDGHNSQEYKTCNLAGRLHLLKDTGKMLNKLGFKKSYDINESTKSKKTRTTNKYGVITFRRFYLFNAFKFLYKNASFYLPRKFEELNQLFTISGSEIKCLQEKHSTDFIRKNREIFVKRYSDKIRYAFPQLFVKNPDVDTDLELVFPTIKEKLIEDKLSITRTIKYLRKKEIELSDSSLRRFINSKGILPHSMSERNIIQENFDQINDDIAKGQNRRTIAERLGVSKRRVARKTFGIKSDSHIEMVNPDYFDTIDNELKAFFSGFLLLRNSINKKYLSIKFKDEKYNAIIIHLAHSLYGVNIPNKMISDRGFKYSFGSIKLISSLRNIFLHEKSTTVIDFIPQKFLRPFILGMFYSGMKIQKIKTGYCSRISGNTDVMKWLQWFLKDQGINVRFESNSERRLVFLKNEYELVVQIFGNQLHMFLTKGLYNVA